MTTSTGVAVPSERFNFAQHLLGLNAGRPAKTAFVDDQGSLSYGQVGPSACAESPPDCARSACTAKNACCC